jgi:hypothetical protein
MNIKARYRRLQPRTQLPRARLRQGLRVAATLAQLATTLATLALGACGDTLAPEPGNLGSTNDDTSRRALQTAHLPLRQQTAHTTMRQTTWAHGSEWRAIPNILIDFAFPLERDGVVRLHYLQNDFAVSWCGQQVPRPFTHPDGSVEYFCGEAESAGSSPDSVGGPGARCSGINHVPTDCGKQYLCVDAPVRVCECDRSSCNINRDLRPTLHLRRQGDELIGVLGPLGAPRAPEGKPTACLPARRSRWRSRRRFEGSPKIACRRR